MVQRHDSRLWTRRDAAQMNGAGHVVFDGLPTPRLIAKATKVRRGMWRQALGIDFLFVEPLPIRASDG